MTTKLKKRALVVRGGWEGHEPRPCTDIFIPWLLYKNYRVTVSDSLDIYTRKRQMRGFHVIIPCWTMGTLTPEQSAGLREAVLNGAGLAGWHGGMCDAFRQDTDYQFMTGGQWVAHPGGIIRYTVRITQPDHPLVRGLRDFRVTSEQYYMHTDPGNEVLATTTFSGRHGHAPWIKGTTMPVAWTRRYGKGRVFYSALGHTAADFDVPEVTELVKRGIQWAARDRVTPEYGR
jgi:type 1 glutamine amidotransferase